MFFAKHEELKTLAWTHLACETFQVALHKARLDTERSALGFPEHLSIHVSYFIGR